ncbi:unnamed protein product [Heligmosomoides polygyrus]|uniref:JmjC domain-containing protein n=1 Tax=Heligmosomoides polygyrus TaxID=6339 RepID=A0A183FVU7_HELPZ|nr:unnamed protein product [Heligmosomoides polygyrus]
MLSRNFQDRSLMSESKFLDRLAELRAQHKQTTDYLGRLWKEQTRCQSASHGTCRQWAVHRCSSEKVVHCCPRETVIYHQPDEDSAQLARPNEYPATASRPRGQTAYQPSSRGSYPVYSPASDHPIHPPPRQAEYSTHPAYQDEYLVRQPHPSEYSTRRSQLKEHFPDLSDYSSHHPHLVEHSGHPAYSGDFTSHSRLEQHVTHLPHLKEYPTRPTHPEDQQEQNLYLEGYSAETTYQFEYSPQRPQKSDPPSQHEDYSSLPPTKNEHSTRVSYPSEYHSKAREIFQRRALSEDFPPRSSYRDEPPSRISAPSDRLDRLTQADEKPTPPPPQADHSADPAQPKDSTSRRRSRESSGHHRGRNEVHQSPQQDEDSTPPPKSSEDSGERSHPEKAISAENSRDSSGRHPKHDREHVLKPIVQDAADVLHLSAKARARKKEERARLRKEHEDAALEKIEEKRNLKAPSSLSGPHSGASSSTKPPRSKSAVTIREPNAAVTKPPLPTSKREVVPEPIQNFVPQITVPVPFKLSTRKAIVNTYSTKFVEELVARQRRNEEELRQQEIQLKPFTAKSVPKSTYVPTNPLVMEKNYVEVSLHWIPFHMIDKSVLAERFRRFDGD